MTLVAGCKMNTYGYGKIGNDALGGLSGKVDWFGKRTKIGLGLKL